MHAEPDPGPPTDASRLHLPRRAFLKNVIAGAGALSLGGELLHASETKLEAGSEAAAAATRSAYTGPNIIIIRFGGGVRRRESIDPEHTYAPFLCHELTRRGTLFKKMDIDFFQDINTSHGEGTLYLITGKYEKYKDVNGRFLGAGFEASVPTIFEYLRKAYDVPSQQTLIVNGEDRGDEEFYNFSNHHLFGARYRSNTLSLRRYKAFLLRHQLADGKFSGKELAKKKADLDKLESADYRHSNANGQGPELDAFWTRWRDFYGTTGFVNPRGDRLLTELTLRALKELRPKLIMVNYNDPDYVHWGNMTHYTRGVAVIDEGLQQLVSFVDSDPEYRDNTIFAIAPDCGRDSNPYAAIPCQHHFNSRSAHEIFALFFGPGIARGDVVDKRVDQIQFASTIGRFMKMPTPFAEKRILEEAFA